MIKNKVKCDYSILEDTLIVNSIFIDKKYRRQGYGTAFLKELERTAQKNNCTKIITPADLSKNAISFWLNNGFNTDDIDDKKIINFVLISKQSDNYIFDIDGSSVLELYKEV